MKKTFTKLFLNSCLHILYIEGVVVGAKYWLINQPNENRHEDLRFGETKTFVPLDVFISHLKIFLISRDPLYTARHFCRDHV